MDTASILVLSRYSHINTYYKHFSETNIFIIIVIYRYWNCYKIFYEGPKSEEILDRNNPNY